MKKRMFSIVAALALCLGMPPGTVWAAALPKDGGDITNTGLYFDMIYGDTTPPKVETVYRAGEGTVTWIPTVENDAITGIKLILDNASFTLDGSGSTTDSGQHVLLYRPAVSKGVSGDVEVILRGNNTVTTSNKYSTVFKFDNKNSAVDKTQNVRSDTYPKLSIKGENGGSLTYKNTATDGDTKWQNYRAIHIKNALTIEDATINLQKGCIWIDAAATLAGDNPAGAPITIKNSKIDISLTGDDIGSDYGLRTNGPDATLHIINSVITINSSVGGISGNPVKFENSEATVTVPNDTSSPHKGISSNSGSLLNSKVEVTGGGTTDEIPMSLLQGTPSDSYSWHEMVGCIYAAGKTALEEKDKELRVNANCTFILTNDAAFNTRLYISSTFTAANVKNLAVPGWTTIKLTDEIRSMTVSGNIEVDPNYGNLTLKYEGSEPQKPEDLVIFTAQSEEDIAKVHFSDSRFEVKGSQIVWKQTPIAAPANPIWDEATAKWSAVAGAAGYDIQLYKNGVEYGEPVPAGPGVTQYDFTGTITETGEYTFTVTAKAGGLLQRDSDPSGPSAVYSYTAPEYAVTVTAGPGGGASADKETAQAGETVTLTCSPEDGYRFVEWTVEEDAVTITDNTFLMPAAAVKIHAAFEPISVTAVALNKQELVLVPEGSGQLTAIITPADAKDKTVAWSSGNEAVALVDQNGVVTAVAEGTAVITVTTADGGFEASCTVTVVPEVTPVTGVTLDRTALSLTVGNSGQLTAAVALAGASSKSVTWSSSNPAVAEVDAAGKVTAKSAGTAVITVLTADGGFTASCTVTVSAPSRPGGSGSSSSGGSSSGGGGSSGGSGSGTSSLPVNTTGQNSASIPTETTARPNAANKDGTSAVRVDTAIANEIIKQAVANKSETVVIAPNITGSVSRTEVSLPAATVSQIGQRTDADLTVSTPVADVTIPNGGLGSLSSAGGTVTVAAEQKGNRVTLTVTSAGRTAEHIPGGLTLTVPVSNAAPGTVAVLVHEDGSREVVRKSVAEKGRVTIPLDGSATLELADNSKSFSDVPAWAEDAAAFVSAHELFAGTEPGIFGADLAMTRGMLAAVLHNLENNPAHTAGSAFADVDSGAWYAGGVAWAAANGIVSGYGSGRFGPDDSITREQLAVMLWRYAGSPATALEGLRFTDADSISAYARTAVRWAVEKGILSGYSSGRFGPQEPATRAQTAQMLKRYLENG